MGVVRSYRGLISKKLFNEQEVRYFALIVGMVSL